MPTLKNFFGQVISADHVDFLVTYFAVGALFASIAFAISVVSVPMMLDRGTDTVVAALTSVRALFANPGPLFLWAGLIVLIVGLGTMPRIARITRGAAVPVVERDFVGAAEALGESRTRILSRELLPNISGPLLVEANLRLTYSIGSIAALGFLGFATRVNAADWGLMINENRIALSVQPWGVVLPALVADGLSRASAGIDRAKGDQ
jgi:ABC-type dipeptide/oligopeptide/nickel transport system permease subunit